MRFARIVFAAAAVYGVVVLFPMYFNEQRLALESPPALTHAEYYYSFIGVTLVWQMLFVLIALHPEQYRTIMLFCVGEKLALLPMFFILNPQGRFPGLWIPAIVIDLLLGGSLSSFVHRSRQTSETGTESMNNFNKDFQQTIEKSSAALRSISEAESAQPRTPGK